MKYSSDGLHLTEQFEGVRYKAYRDSAGVLTCGYGHTKGVTSTTRCDDLQAIQWLRQDILESEHFVNSVIKVPLTQGEFDALVDFDFNVGDGGLGRSTLLIFINRGQFAAAANEFAKWDHAGGKVVAGLLRRRLAEKEVFLKPDKTATLKKGTKP